MAKMIFVNLPVADVAKATEFDEAIGRRLTRNPIQTPCKTSMSKGD